MRNLLYSIIFVCIGLLILLLIGTGIQYTAGHSSFWYKMRNGNSSTSIEAISIGNSHNSVLDFKALGLKGHHFWLTDMDLDEMLALVVNDHFQSSSLKYVFLHLSNGTLLHRNQGCSYVKTFELEKVRRHFYRTFDFRYLIDGDFKNYLMSMLSIFYQKKDLSYFWSEELSPEQKKNMVFNSRVITDDGQMSSQLQLYTKSQALQDAQSQIKKEMQMRDIILNCHPNIEKENILKLESLAQTLSNRSVQLILYRAPVTRQYDELYPHEAKKKAEELCDRMALKPNVICLNFNNYMLDNYREFEDSSHLNITGINQFSKFFKSQLIEQDFYKK